MNSPVHVIFNRKWDTSLHLMLQNHLVPSHQPLLYLHLWCLVHLISFVSCQVIMKVRFGLKHALSFDSKNYLYLSAGQNVQAGCQKKKKQEENKQPPQRHNASLQLRLLCVWELTTLWAEADKSILNSSPSPRKPQFDNRQLVNCFEGSRSHSNLKMRSEWSASAGHSRHLLLWVFFSFLDTQQPPLTFLPSKSKVIL